MRSLLGCRRRSIGLCWSTRVPCQSMMHRDEPGVSCSKQRLNCRRSPIPRRSNILPRMKHILMGMAIVLAAASLDAQQPAAPAPATRSGTLVSRLDLDKYKATVKGLTAFGDRRQGTERNRKAVDWIEAQLKSYGCPTERLRYEYNPEPPAGAPAVVVARAAGRSRPTRSLRAVKCDPDRAARATAGPRGEPASTTMPTPSPTKSCASSIANRPSPARVRKSTAPRSAPRGPTRCTSSARTWMDTAGARPRTTTARAPRW